MGHTSKSGEGGGYSLEKWEPGGESGPPGRYWWALVPFFQESGTEWSQESAGEARLAHGDPRLGRGGCPSRGSRRARSYAAISGGVPTQDPCQHTPISRDFLAIFGVFLHPPHFSSIFRRISLTFGAIRSRFCPEHSITYFLELPPQVSTAWGGRLFGGGVFHMEHFGRGHPAKGMLGTRWPVGRRVVEVRDRGVRSSDGRGAQDKRQRRDDSDDY